jgi:AAA+ superfamily predicted ATPase
VTTTTATDWGEANRRHLQAHIDRLVPCLTDEVPPPPVTEVPTDGPWVLDQITDAFGLTDFERDVLVLAAAAEIDPRVAAEVGADRGCGCHGLTFAAALQRVPGAHWSALSPTAPLRRWRLLRVGGAPAAVVRQPLHIDDRVLLAVLGVTTVDAALDRLCRPLPVPALVPDSTRRGADELVRRWTQHHPGPVQVIGRSADARHDTIAMAAAELGLRACVVAVSALPQDPTELDEFIRIVERETLLGRVAVAVDAVDGDPASYAALDAFTHRVAVYAAVSTRQRLTAWPDSLPAVDVAVPSHAEVLAHWEELVEPSEALADIAFAFPVAPAAVAGVITEAQQEATETGVDLHAALRSSARRRTRASLDALATRINIDARWDDLVLPEPAARALRAMAAHVRQRRIVHHEWGFADGVPPAVTALLHGPSGTGKTLAARVLASELGLDLYAIDLAQVVSKYIGETEKHLQELFDRADRGSCVLLFDEADALFGARSEVHDAHDRYANIEVSYLLQRIESFRGLAILTSNLHNNIDQAFTRRLRYVVAFPFPDAPARAQLWRQVFPPGVPVKELDVDVLARLSITGAAIASIALSAAVLAADAASPVTMSHLLQAARTEYLKSDRQLTATELQGWDAA